MTISTDRFPAVRRLPITIACCALALLAGAAPVFAQTAASQYATLQKREQTLRASQSPAPITVRRLAVAYQDIVRLWPKSGYADNALWQAAGLLQLAADQGGTDADREGAARLLRVLKREYPTSSLVSLVEARLRALGPKSPGAASVPRSASAASGPSPSSHVPAATAPRAPSSTETAPPATVPASARTATAELRTIARASLPKGDRLTLEFSAEPLFVSTRTTTPDQLRFTFSGASVSPRTIISAAMLQGPLARTVRVGSPAAGTLELMIELAGSPRYSAFPLYDPYRLVIDLEADPDAPAAPAPRTVSAPNGAVRPSAGAQDRPAASVPGRASTAAVPPPAPSSPKPGGTDSKPSAAASTSRGDYSLARQLGLGISRIVIDAGHGGHDPGAQANGVSEAELVLDIALRAEALLEDQPGFDVVLTRRTDQFIALEERTALANRERADLFLSIHANSSPQSATRGIETYFLNFAENPQAEEVAARENAATAKTMGLLPQIVKAIANNNKLAESRELAGMVQSSLLRRVRTQNPSAQDLGVKQAPFMVLIGAQMPSVLAEVSFLTNRADAALLKQPAYRQKIAQALADAVLKYQASLKKAVAVAGTRYATENPKAEVRSTK